MRFLFLLGAGASFGCGPVEPFRPPLGKDLFGELGAKYPTWGQLPREAQLEFQRDGLFEPGFVWVRANMDHLSAALLREMALYFLQFRPKQGNAYAELIDTVLGWKTEVTIATLNYDLILDIVVAGKQKGTIDYDIPSSTGRVPILKLHGAPNILPTVPLGMISGTTFANNKRAAYSGPMEFASIEKSQRRWSADDSLGPAMALYAPGKDVLMSPEIVEHIQRSYWRAAQSVEKIYVVGVSYVEHDSHVWDVLISTPAAVVIANPDGSTYARFMELRGSRPTSFTPIKFQEFLAELQTGTL
jgi:hypothetical protein